MNPKFQNPKNLKTLKFQNKKKRKANRYLQALQLHIDLNDKETERMVFSMNSLQIKFMRRNTSKSWKKEWSLSSSLLSILTNESNLFIWESFGNALFKTASMKKNSIYSLDFAQQFLTHRIHLKEEQMKAQSYLMMNALRCFSLTHCFALTFLQSIK